MEVSEAIAGRRAVREYTSELVEEQTIRRLIADAVQAPSAINEQPWAFTVVRDQTLLNNVSLAAKAYLLANTPPDKLPQAFKSMLADAQYQIFYHAPVLIVISATMIGEFVVEDCTLAAANLMLSAYDVGLGSCWIGSVVDYLKTTVGKAAFDLPESYAPVAAIILGHPKAMPPLSPRKSPEIHWVGNS